MPLGEYSTIGLENLWRRLWLEIHNIEVEAEEPPYNTAVVLEAFVRIVNTTSPEHLKISNEHQDE